MSIKRKTSQRNLKVKANCVLVFEFFQLKNLQTENFVNCFVICFDIGGLAKNKEGKGPWNYFDYLHCGNEESAFNNENAQL